MKHAQRQYAIKRLNEIHQFKIKVLQENFQTTEAARTDIVKTVGHIYPDFGDVLRKLAGMDSQVVLADNYRAHLQSYVAGTSGYIYPGNLIHLLAKPTNDEDVTAATAYNLAMTARHKAQVADKIELLKVKLVESTDALVLGNEEAAVEALAAFQNFEV